MKKLNTNSITNELEHSSFFPAKPAENREAKPAPEPTPAHAVPEPIQVTQPQQAPLSRPKEPTRKATTKPIGVTTGTSRPYVRRTFDLYEDQLAYLTRVSLEERLAGGEGSMNAMVRAALDAFIAKRQKEAA